MSDPQDPNAPKIPATPARQGRPGKPILLVLIISTALAGLLLLGSWLFRADDLAETAPHAGRQASDAQVFDESAPAPRIPQPEAVDRAGPAPDPGAEADTN